MKNCTFKDQTQKKIKNRKYIHKYILQDIMKYLKFHPNFQIKFIEDPLIYLSKKKNDETTKFDPPRRIYFQKRDARRIVPSRENRSKRALSRTEFRRNLTTQRIVERPQPPRIFPSPHSQPTNVAWIQPIRGTISWEGGE